MSKEPINIEEMRRDMVREIGIVRIGKEVNMPYQTAGRYVEGQVPRKGTEIYLAIGAYNAAESRIKELEKELLKLRNMLPELQNWVEETRG